MSGPLNQSARVIDALVTLLAGGVKWLALVMVLITLAIVVLRYIFNMGAIPLRESVMYMHGLLFLIGIPYGLRQNTHVRVDILYANRLRHLQKHINLFGHIVFLVPVSIFIIYTSWSYVIASWQVLEGSAEVGGLPAIFLLKSLIPLCGLLLLLQGLVEILRLLNIVPTTEQT